MTLPEDQNPHPVTRGVKLHLRSVSTIPAPQHPHPSSCGWLLAADAPEGGSALLFCALEREAQGAASQVVSGAGRSAPSNISPVRDLRHPLSLCSGGSDKVCTERWSRQRDGFTCFSSWARSRKVSAIYPRLAKYHRLIVRGRTYFGVFLWFLFFILFFPLGWGVGSRAVE